MILRRLQYEMAGYAGPTLLRFQEWQKLRARKGKKSKSGAQASPFGPPFECVGKLKELMSLHYLQGRYADGAVPVAWVTSGFPVEILRPLGFHALYPENHAAMCGVVRMVPKLSDAAEKEGYARDLCSYARTDLGCCILNTTPAGRLPKPDLLCCCTNICQSVLYWYKALAARYNVPLVLIDTPFVYGEAKPHHVSYVRAQLEELVKVAERVSGKRTDPGKLKDIMTRSKEGARLWGECLATAQAKPAPWTGIDGFFHMAPIVALRGSEECNAYYRMLRDELKDRLSRGIGGIADEKHRLLWDNLPMWFAVRELSTLLAERGFNFACTSYTNAWAEAGIQVDPADPMGSASRSYMHIILNQDLRNRQGILTRLARDYSCDGAVLHSDRSCKPYSVGQVDLKERLMKEMGIKVLMLESDHNDPRAWASEPGANRLTAFMESFA
jgi:benzoyl-CoA reductase/2-hydroxyglutaryl-CoA dehydratase subunit BcrC/BadD/HgdB